MGRMVEEYDGHIPSVIEPGSNHLLSLPVGIGLVSSPSIHQPMEKGHLWLHSSSENHQSIQTSMGRARLDVCPMIGEYGLPEWVLRIAH